MADDEKWMSLALELAAMGRGSVEPNPMVGAVIVRGEAELARGWHKRFGGPHAEAEALGAARDAGRDVRGATMYVTLEPCCHRGKKTPPCTDALTASGVSRVVAAMEDPDPNVRGRGLAALRAAGIDVAVGVSEQEARELLGAYVKLRTEGRPWVICKWAQTADGFLALPPGRGRWISCEQSREEAHELRGRCDGVCAGIGTVLADDPLLTNRSGMGRQPARLVLDSTLRIPPASQLVRTADRSPVIVATTRGGGPAKSRAAANLRRAGVEVLELPEAPGGVDLGALLDELGRRQWTYLLVEGGARVLDGFLRAGLADELLVFVAPMTAGARPDGVQCPPSLNIDLLAKELRLRETESRRVGPDRVLRFRLHS